jgi:peptidoglycan/LPS O-acetylase OafA/YrhL
MRLAEIFDRDRNNFDLIRLFAALTVIFGHSFYLFPTGGYAEPVTQLVARNFSGTLAVGIFFFISGMLIPESFVHSRSLPRYVLARIGRIYPGTTACFLLTVFVVGPAVTTLPIQEYFASPAPYKFLRDNWSFTRLIEPAGGFVDTLPGVFEANILKGTVNGSLWTLYPEIACYAYVFVAGMLGCLTSARAINLSIAALVAVHFIHPASIPYFSDDHYSDPLKVACCFLAGAFAYANRQLLVIKWRYSAILVAIAIAMNRTEWAEYFLYAGLLYTVLVVAAAPKLHAIKLPGDYSFGVYIYGFLIQQTMGRFFPHIESYPSNLICLPAALLMGYLSWNFVEFPSMRLVRRFAESVDTKIQSRAALKWLKLRNGRLAVVDDLLRRAPTPLERAPPRAD